MQFFTALAFFTGSEKFITCHISVTFFVYLCHTHTHTHTHMCQNEKYKRKYHTSSGLTFRGK